MRIHLGHHFYGAGNLGDDFMLAGFLAGMRRAAPDASFTGCVPFAREPLQARFPQVDWRPYDDRERRRCIEASDVWLGVGGSPFQSAQSRWFIDHLLADSELCGRAGKPMFYLGVGVQTPAELDGPEVRRVLAQSAGIWTRDAGSARRLRALPSPPRVEVASDLAHLCFQDSPPPPAARGRLTLVPNFDFNAWPGQNAFLAAAHSAEAREHVWLAQESRALPGAERALHAALPPDERARWSLVAPDEPGAPLAEAVTRWPSGEWLVTARYHAALAGAWAGSKVVVISTNEKLRAAAADLDAPQLAPDADTSAAERALRTALPCRPPHHLAERALAACVSLVRSAVAESG